MRFLIVEDEHELNELLYEYISDSFSDALITQCFDGDEALELVTTKTYDLVLLDVMLPGSSGLEVCKALKKSSSTPVLMLSALNDEQTQLTGYNLGIDEYVTKPFSPKLVIKKIEAILTRVYNMNKDIIEYGLISYDVKTYDVYIEDSLITLNKKEQELLHLFIHNPSIIFTREQLILKNMGI